MTQRDNAPAVPFGRRVKRFMADRPLVPLIILLVAWW